jgi:hypothetical protein
LSTTFGEPNKGYIINGARSSALESGPNGIPGTALGFCCSALIGYWHKADIPTRSTNIRFRG